LYMVVNTEVIGLAPLVVVTILLSKPM
jgi:hypothetical protein